eukprot:snap_masked-scaffold_6-processed-gene-18.22-mRNA-1 protein AED:1.00 eAED:1.00 QI:0/-1/0/0/-1/1/1/0/217
MNKVFRKGILSTSFVLTQSRPTAQISKRLHTQPNYYSKWPNSVAQISSFPLVSSRSASSNLWRRNMTTANQKNTEQVSGLGRARDMIQKYGPLGIATYFGVYFATLGGIYGLVAYDFIPAGDMEKWLEKFVSKETQEKNKEKMKERLEYYFPGKFNKQSEKIDEEEDSGVPKRTAKHGISTFISAWLLTKLTEPFRIVLTAGLTPAFAKVISIVFRR